MRRGVIVVCVANIPTAVRITTHAHTSRAERNIRPSDDVDDSIAQQRRIRNCHGEIARPNGLTLPSVAEALQALARTWTVLKVILGEAHAKRRVLERSTPIDTCPVNGGARPIDRRWNWAGQQVGGVDDAIVTTRIREHHRRDEPRVTEVVREECTPGL